MNTFQFDKTDGTAIFIMVVSPAVLAHDVSARAAGDLSMGIAVAPGKFVTGDSALER